jgi:hypothetical protein
MTNPTTLCFSIAGEFITQHLIDIGATILKKPTLT